jgi:hypothetical protein
LPGPDIITNKHEIGNPIKKVIENLLIISLLSSISFALQEASAANLRSRPAFGTPGLFAV